MRLSAARKNFIYSAIHTAIMELRLRLIREKDYTIHQPIDAKIARVIEPLYAEVVRAVEQPRKAPTTRTAKKGRKT